MARPILSQVIIGEDRIPTANVQTLGTICLLTVSVKPPSLLNKNKTSFIVNLTQHSFLKVVLR